MAADLFSNFIGMTLQATGNNNNAWGTILNGSTLTPLERRISRQYRPRRHRWNARSFGKLLDRPQPSPRCSTSSRFFKAS